MEPLAKENLILFFQSKGFSGKMPDCGTHIEHNQGVPGRHRLFIRGFPCSICAESFIGALDGMPNPGRLFFSAFPGQAWATNPIYAGIEGLGEKCSGRWVFSGGAGAFVYTGPGTFDHVDWTDINGFSREKKDGGTAWDH